jgi:hypothetical protein
VDQTPIYAELVYELGVADRPRAAAAARHNAVNVDGIGGEQVPSSGGLPADAAVPAPQVPADDSPHPLFDPADAQD